jgi:hypothetical protein
MTRGAIVAAVALLLALPVGAMALDVKTVLDTLGFPDDTEAKVRGEDARGGSIDQPGWLRMNTSCSGGG